MLGPLVDRRPVVIIDDNQDTANALQALVRTMGGEALATEAGFDAHMTKPPALDELQIWSVRSRRRSENYSVYVRLQ